MSALQNAVAALDAEICVIGCNFELHREGGVGQETGFRRMPELEETWKAFCINRDFEAAVRSARPLAEAGIAYAQMVVGLALWSGLGNVRDVPEAVCWLTKAAEQGDPEACDALAVMYYGGSTERGVDPELGAHYKERAQYYGISM